MGYKIIDNADDSIEININSHIHCSLYKDSTLIGKIRQSYNPYRIFHGIKNRNFDCHKINPENSFLEIYGCPRNAMVDAASSIQYLTKEYKKLPYHEREEFYRLKIQLTKILYEGNKCISANRELDINNKYNISFKFVIDDNFYCWHVPEDEIKFKVFINNDYNKLRPLYCSPIIKNMVTGRKLALVAWVINNWNKYNNQN